MHWPDGGGHQASIFLRRDLWPDRAARAGGRINLEAGLAEYTDFVEASRFFFQIFSGAQDILSRVPVRWIDSVARLVNHKRVLLWVLDQYWGLTRDWDKTSRTLLDEPVIEN